jgi:hypothetical protein
MTFLPVPGSIHSPEHPVPGVESISSQRRQTSAGHHRPVVNPAVEYGSSGQSPIISGFQPLAILRKPSPAKAPAAPNPHRRPNAHRFPAGSFFGGFRTPALYPVDRSRRAPASETLYESGHSANERNRRRRPAAIICGPTVIVPIDNLWWPGAITV